MAHYDCCFCGYWCFNAKGEPTCYDSKEYFETIKVFSTVPKEIMEMVKYKYKLYMGTSSDTPREYEELWEAQAVLKHTSNDKLPACILQGSKCIEVRAKEVVSNSANMYDR